MGTGGRFRQGNQTTLSVLGYLGNKNTLLSIPLFDHVISYKIASLLSSLPWVCIYSNFPYCLTAHHTLSTMCAH